MSDPPRVVHQDEASLISTWRSAMFSVMGPRPMTRFGAQSQVSACLNHGRSIGLGRMVEVVLLDPRVSFPSDEVRAVLMAGAPKLGPYYAGVGTIFESVGFRAVVIRGILRSLQLASPTAFPQQVFASSRPCMEWVVRVAADAGTQRFTVQEMSEALSHVRGAAQRAGILGLP